MKETFMLYTEILETVRDMSDEEAGVLFKAILHHEANEEYMPGDEHREAAVAFSFIRRQLDRLDQKYEEMVEKRREAGKSGAAKRWQNMANDSKAIANDGNAIANDSKTKQAMANDSLPLPLPLPLPQPHKEKEKESKEREKPEKSPAVVIAKLDAPDGVKQRLQGFVDMRRTMKKPMTGRAVELLWKELSKLSSDPATQEKILDQSIMNSWQSVYPLKSEPRARSGTSQLDQFLRIARGEDDISGNGENHINDQGLFSSVL